VTPVREEAEGQDVVAQLIRHPSLIKTIREVVDFYSSEPVVKVEDTPVEKMQGSDYLALEMVTRVKLSNTNDLVHSDMLRSLNYCMTGR
jgi:hypothetical protein